MCKWKLFAVAPHHTKHTRAQLTQFEWRNGWFYGLTKDALAAGKPDPCPAHTAILKEVGAI